MAWVASSTGFLLIAASSFWEAASVVRPAAIQLVSLSMTTSNSISGSTPSSISHLTTHFNLTTNSVLAKSAITSPIENPITKPVVATGLPSKLLPSLSTPTQKKAVYQDKFSTIVNLSQLSLLSCASKANTPWTRSTPGMFPVFLNGCRVAELARKSDADYLQRRLLQLSQEPNIDWQRVLQPGLMDQAPVIRLGDEVLLTISPQVANRLGQHPHTLAVKWTNGIRQAMGAPAISMAVAQKQMYNLQTTAAITQGAASWYGPYFHGRLTANGETFNQYDLTAAHRELPLGSFVKVTNRQNGQTVVVRINDRGPYHDEDNRVLDLSYQAAKVLGGEARGIIPIEMQLLKTVPKSKTLAQSSNSQMIAFLK
jgi:hypothetical protein